MCERERVSNRGRRQNHSKGEITQREENYGRGNKGKIIHKRTGK